MRALASCAALAFALTAVCARAQEPAQAAAVRSTLQIAVVVSRHGIRAPLNFSSLDKYAAQPWPAWPAAAGELTEHGARMMQAFGAEYRRYYAAEGALPQSGCPEPGTVYFWADREQRTMATAQALARGVAPDCDVPVDAVESGTDTLFHAVPALGKGDAETARAALDGIIGAAPDALLRAYYLPFARLDAILDCRVAACLSVTSVPSAIKLDRKSGLASLAGPLDVASTAAENLLLEYAEGMPEPGWGRLDRQAVLDIAQLHILAETVNHGNPYVARAEGSNLLAHVAATLDQAAAGVKKPGTRVPPGARFAALVGHDTNLANLAGILRLSWLLPGYQFNDTPPGGALVFELRRPAKGAPFVRLFYTAQSLDAMRGSQTNAPVERVPVYVPGCPTLDCPLPTFDAVAKAAIDPRFVGTW
jgi:4-phytase / acid phosphatase